MGTWLTVAELRSRYGEERVDGLADRNGDGSPDTGQLEAAISEAESRARSRLLVRFEDGDLPTSTATASPALKRVVAGLAYWYLHELHQLKGQDVIDAQGSALAELSDLARGQAALLLADGTAPGPVARPQILTSKTVADAVFTRDTLKAW